MSATLPFQNKGKRQKAKIRMIHRIIGAPAVRRATRLACRQRLEPDFQRTPTFWRIAAASASLDVMAGWGAGRTFSKVSGDGSHSDFAPQSKVQLGEGVEEFIDNAVKEHDVLLFMKGTPEAPRCGFSAQVVQVLQQEGIDFSSADVLASDEVREGIKKYSDWPTIPQLYVNGEFVGGCDILVEMHQSGELAKILESIKSKQVN